MASGSTTTVTNPILLWLFRHGWEDPGWGHSRMDQITIGLAIHDLAAKLDDERLGLEIRQMAQKHVAKIAQEIAK
jgi:hypothetical protein